MSTRPFKPRLRHWPTRSGQNWGACRLICGETKTEAFLPAAEGSCAPRKSCPIIDLNKSKDYGQNLPIATAFEKKNSRRKSAVTLWTVSSILVPKWCLNTRGKLWDRGRDQCRINANRGPWQLFARGPLLTRNKDLSKLAYMHASELTLDSGTSGTASPRVGTTCWQLFRPDINTAHFKYFVAEVMSNYLTTDGLKNFLYFRRPPWGLRPVAFATSATWLIRHWPRLKRWPVRLRRQKSVAGVRPRCNFRLFSQSETEVRLQDTLRWLLDRGTEVQGHVPG